MCEIQNLTTGFREFEFPKCQKVREIQIPKCQKVRENSNSQNPVASITISYILCALDEPYIILCLKEFTVSLTFFSA